MIDLLIDYGADVTSQKLQEAWWQHREYHCKILPILHQKMKVTPGTREYEQFMKEEAEKQLKAEMAATACQELLKEPQ